MRTRCLPALLLAFFVSSLPVFAQGDDEIVLENVVLRPGVTTDLHLQVFDNESHPCNGRTTLAVPGFAHTAATFAPLTQAIFAGEASGQAPCRVVALDFPGRGDSPVPSGLPFGFLLLDDYVTAVLGALHDLDAKGVHVDSILAHSQGGLVIQMAQQRLIDAGSSLREAHQVRDAVLLAPVPVAQVAWSFADSGIALAILGGFLATDPALGPHFAIPDAVWGPVFFSNLAGIVSPDAPSAADIATFGYNALEPLLAALQLVGALELAGFPPTPRPGGDMGIFGPGSGTTLKIVAFTQDQIIRPSEGTQLYAYLTGDSGLEGFVEVSGAFSVHDMYVSDPAALLAALPTSIRIR